MKGREPAVISGVLVFVCAIAFYMLILSPKRAEVSEQNEKIESLNASISQQEQLVTFGEQARKEFPHDYGRLVVLGKAVPDEADTASLLVELNAMSYQADVEFRGIALSDGSGDVAAQPAAATPTPSPTDSTSTSSTESTDSSSGGTSTDSSTTETTTATTSAVPVAATEAGAASLPIGATVGTAGLPTMPYDLKFTGGFFGIANYIGHVDDLVQFDGKNDQVSVNGRLLTVDGFALTGGQPGSDPTLDAKFALTSYVTPSTEGQFVGASPTGPAVGTAPTTPASATTVAP